MMFFLKLYNKNKKVEPKTADKIYKDAIEKKIRLRYSVSDELGFSRKMQIGEDIAEFEKYNDYVKQCIAEVKAEFGLAEGVI